MKRTATFLVTGALAFAMFSCGGNGGPEPEQKNANKEKSKERAIGAGPIQEVHLEALDNTMAEKGKTVFEAKCTACHKIETRHVGPPMKGVTERREPEWIMNMIINPERMVKEDETARELLAEYISPMANQGITEDEARAILEYFRQIDKQ